MKKEISTEKRDIIINFYNQGMIISEIFRKLNISKSTVSRTIKRFRETGNANTNERGGNRRSVFTNAHGIAIKSHLDENSTLSLSAIRAKLVADFEIFPSLSSITRAITHFHYSIKSLSVIPVRRNTRDNIEERFCYSQKFLNYLSQNDETNFIFIDEGWIQISMRKGRGRSEVGRRAVSVVQNIRTKNISVCAAMMKTGVVHRKIEPTAYNTMKFEAFLQELTSILNDKGKHDAVFVMDNVPFHKSAEIKTFIEASGHGILYLPPYSPFLNPIENLFSQWKTKVRFANCMNEEELNFKIQQALNEITEEHCSNYYRNM
ncbi:Paired box protein Pax-5, partial [Cucumispora dikerogammari]